MQNKENANLTIGCMASGSRTKPISCWARLHAFFSVKLERLAGLDCDSPSFFSRCLCLLRHLSMSAYNRDNLNH